MCTSSAGFSKQTAMQRHAKSSSASPRITRFDFNTRARTLAVAQLKSYNVSRKANHPRYEHRAVAVVQALVHAVYTVKFSCAYFSTTSRVLNEGAEVRIHTVLTSAPDTVQFRYLVTFGARKW